VSIKFLVEAGNKLSTGIFSYCAKINNLFATAPLAADKTSAQRDVPPSAIAYAIFFSNLGPISISIKLE